MCKHNCNKLGHQSKMRASSKENQGFRHHSMPNSNNGGAHIHHQYQRKQHPNEHHIQMNNNFHNIHAHGGFRQLQSLNLQTINSNIDNRLSPICNSAMANTPSKKESQPSISPPRSPAVPNVYGGSKFHDPPSPKVLPKPPVHWVNNENDPQNCAKLTNVLKVMLNVHA